MPVNEHTARALQAALDRMHGTDHARSGAETASEMRARLSREEAEAARRNGQLNNPFGPRVTPENIDEVIGATQRDLAQAKATAANTAGSPSARANARQHIEDHKRRLDRLHQLKPIAEAHAEVVRSDSPESRAKLQKLQDELARSDAKKRESGKTVMDVIQKSASATVAPVESDFPGQFEVILSTETMDRDDENLWASEWKQPLPARIHIDGDHGRSLDKTVGSAVPVLEGNRMVGKGTYAGTPYAQMVRQLVNEGHVNSVSVTYAERKNQKGEGVQRELLNAAFVTIPANPEAVVLSSKAAKLKADGGFSASGNNPDVKHDDMVQAIHDAAAHLGAQCLNAADADPGTADGANKSIHELDRETFSSFRYKAAEETSSPKEAGSPQESPDESPAEVATKAAAPAPAPAEVPTEAADDSADDAAAQKAKEAEKARALAWLIGMNAKD